MIKLKNNKILDKLEQSVSIAPLITFRVGFALVMLFSSLRYIYRGWIDEQLIDPFLHFKYFGFEWVEPLPGIGMYLIFGVMICACLGILLGAFYRVSTIVFFICFTYIELIDITYYLNHYYFVSIIALLLIVVPANRAVSLDAKWKPEIKSNQVQRWTILIFQLQIAIVYIYAGLAKINTDWLLESLPLAIWLPAKTSIPLIGELFSYKITPLIFSWAGMLFDTFIIFGLIWRKTRLISYVAVIVFHAMTGILFQIGVFPIVMIFAVLIFFSEEFHQGIWKPITDFTKSNEQNSLSKSPKQLSVTRNFIFPLLALHFLFQILFPWRYLLYPGNIFWTEEGYRFAWRVMLMEKAGTATFYVKDGPNGREGAVMNRKFLNDHQEKQMAMQPDLILQYAHFLEEYYKSEGMENPQVRVKAYVTLNASSSRLLIDPNQNLTEVRDSFHSKKWILPFNQ